MMRMMRMMAFSTVLLIVAAIALVGCGLPSTSNPLEDKQNQTFETKRANLSNFTFNYLGAQDNPHASCNGNFDAVEVKTGDINNDGRADIIWNLRTGIYNKICVATGQSNGSFVFYPAVTIQHFTTWAGAQWHIGDINGDGRVDMIWSKQSGTSFNIYTAISQFVPSPLFPSFTYSTTSYHQNDCNGTWDGHALHMGDLSGDGKADIIINRVDSTGTSICTAASNGTTFGSLHKYTFAVPNSPNYKLFVVKMNNSARYDILWNDVSNYNKVYKALGGYDATIQYVSFPSTFLLTGWAGYETSIGDFNGDGLSDLLWTQSPLHSFTVTAWGASTAQFTLKAFDTLSATSGSNYQLLFGDVNGDQKTDIVRNHLQGTSNHLYVSFPEANGGFESCPKQTFATYQWSSTTPLLADIDGDGNADMIWNYRTSTTNRVRRALANP